GGSRMSAVSRGREGRGHVEVRVRALYRSGGGEEEANDLLLGRTGRGRYLRGLHGEEAVRVGEARRGRRDHEIVAVEGDEWLERARADDLFRGGIGHGAVAHSHLDQH